MTTKTATTNIETALTPISQAQRMLAEAKTLPDLKTLRDYATGAKAWAKARGMGIGAENEATEVILRAEREIGRVLIEMAESGERQSRGLTITKNRAKRWGQEVSDDNFQTPATLADLGFSNKKLAWDWQRLAALPDDRFEAMIHAVRAIEDGRLAKTNFYTALDKAERKRSGADDARPTAIDPNFEAFRRGTYGLLGWEVDDEGFGTATKNGLLGLPNDELAQTATLIKALAVAFNEARVARA